MNKPKFVVVIFWNQINLMVAFICFCKGKARFEKKHHLLKNPTNQLKIIGKEIVTLSREKN